MKTRIDLSAFFAVAFLCLPFLLSACHPGVKSLPGIALIEMRWEYGQVPDDFEELIQLTEDLYCENGKLENITKSLHVACKALDIKPDDAYANHLVSRSCFWLIEHGEPATCYDKEENINIFLNCSKFGEKAVNGAPDNAEYQLYYALNMGLQIKDANWAKAIFKISTLMKTLENSIKLDDSLREGGALRVLAMIYLKAPPWPTGVGDEEKALELLETAVDKYPEHPLNHCFYAEALMEDEEYEDALNSIETARTKISPKDRYWRTENWRNMIDLLEQKIIEEMDVKE